MTQDNGGLNEGASVRVLDEFEAITTALRNAGFTHVPPMWRADVCIEKRLGDWTAEQIATGMAPEPYEVYRNAMNLLMYGGASCLWECLIGNGTGTGGQTLTYFNNGNAYIGVGDSSASEVATHTDLQASSNKVRVAMDATYPTHTDGTTSGAASTVWRSTFGSSSANFVWNEWGIFNGSSGGRMLNRKVSSLGTKVSGATWQLTITLTLS